MSKFFDIINSIPVDKYQHFIGGVVVFAPVHFFFGPVVGFSAQLALHVAKKLGNIAIDLRDKQPIDWTDVIGDVFAGVLGGAAAWACIPVYLP